MGSAHFGALFTEICNVFPAARPPGAPTWGAVSQSESHSSIASLQQRGTLTRTNNGNKHAGWSTQELADLHPPPHPNTVSADGQLISRLTRYRRAIEKQRQHCRRHPYSESWSSPVSSPAVAVRQPSLALLGRGRIVALALGIHDGANPAHDEDTEGDERTRLAASVRMVMITPARMTPARMADMAVVSGMSRR